MWDGVERRRGERRRADRRIAERDAGDVAGRGAGRKRKVREAMRRVWLERYGHEFPLRDGDD
jgi:hypothetical protein